MKKVASKLVDTYLELKHRIRLDNTWASGVNGTTSIAILYKQFIALSEKVGLPVAQLWPAEAIRFFENGIFIKEKPLEKYATVLLDLESYEPVLAEYSSWKRETFKKWQLTNLFNGLVSFKLATDFRYFGALEGIEVGGAYAHSLKMNVLNKEALSKIDQLLADLIDPEKTVFDLEMLVGQGGYPIADYESTYLQERLDEELGN